MATYHEWNQGILSYFITGVPRGSAVFLAVDDEVFGQIGHAEGFVSVHRPLRSQMVLLDGFDQGHQLPLPTGSQATNEDSRRDFCAAVRQRVVDTHDSINLNRVQGRDKQGVPESLAFLCAMVLAASYMAEEQTIDANNYFARFRQILGLPAGVGRPKGLDSGAEEPLWQDWGRWLLENGYLPTARSRGGQGYGKYIDFPISQTLLRQGDKTRLRKLFADKGWAADWDADTLAAHVRQELLGALPQHVRELLTGEQQRFQAIAEAMLDVYDGWKEDPLLGPTYTHHTRTVRAGLYREEDRFRGQVDYYLYPRQPRGQTAVDIVVVFEGQLETLEEDRPGWFRPLGPLTMEELTKGVQLEISESSHFDSLILPARPFWLLVPDSDNPDSGIYASWKAPTLGTAFIVVCQSVLVPQLEHLRAERLIDWTGEPTKPLGGESWVELRGCMVLAQDWSGVFIQSRELFDSLRPKVSIDMSMSGGLRVPGQPAWIDEQGPQVTVFGFYPSADVRVIDVNNVPVLETTQKTNEPFPIAWPGPGNYRVEASSGGGTLAQRLVKIVSWQDLHMADVAPLETLSLGGAEICGAAIDATG